MKMYGKYLKHQIKSSMQYRSATFMNMFVSSLAVFAGLIGFVLVFQDFKTLGSYTLNDILITFSVSTMVFSIAELFFRGFDLFDTLIIKGELDVLFLRPRSIILQVLGHKIEIGKVGRVVLSLGILVWVILTSSISWSMLKVLTIILMVISGVVIFFGVMLLSASFTIFTVVGNEIVNIFTHGGADASSYPLDVYKKAFKNFFTFVVPFACFNYLPLQFILDKPSATILGNMLSPVFGMLFVIPCIFIFKWSLTKYTSSGT